jgi:hypothetical protein
MLFTLLAVLVATLCMLRLQRRPPPLNVDRVPSRNGQWWAAHAAIALCLVPLLRLLPVFLTRHSLLTADAQAHAGVALAIARGLPHSWVDTYNGGFPFGPHYQSLALLVTAALIKCGMHSVLAVNFIGLFATLLCPFLFLECLRAARTEVGPALVAALLVMFSAAHSPFMELLGTYFAQGLLSQAVGMVFLLLSARVLLAGPNALMPLLTTLLLAAHAQLGVLAVLLAGPMVLLACDARLLRRYVFGAAAAIAASVALYVPGARTMNVPFSWPRKGVEEIATFPRGVLSDWFTEDVLDYGRAPVFIAVTLFSFAGVVMHARLARHRALLAGVALLILSMLAGRGLWGTRLAFLLEIVSPLRAAALASFAAGAVVAIGLTAWSQSLLTSKRAHVMGVLAAVGAAFFGLHTRGAWLASRANLEHAWVGATECGPTTPAGYRTQEVAKWMHALPFGRIVTDAASFTLVPGASMACTSMHGLDVESTAPLGAAPGGPGSQVGVMQLAFDAIRADAPNTSLRAESLGVRALLHTRQHRPKEGFSPRAQRGDVELSVRMGGSDYLGVGCTKMRLLGPYRMVRDHLLATLDVPGSILERPNEFIELVTHPGALVSEPLPRDDCNTDSAVVSEIPREPGAYEGQITTATPVDVVVRATAFPTWTITVDGASQPIKVVAPGFPAIRVPAGSHHIVATVSAPHFYGLGLCVAAVCVTLLAFVAHKWGTGKSGLSGSG